jgi:hypothetical protein
MGNPDYHESTPVPEYQPIRDFVDRHHKIIEIDAELEIEGVSVETAITQNEVGKLEVTIEDSFTRISAKSYYEELTGTTKTGKELTLYGVHVLPFPLTITLVGQITIDGSSGRTFSGETILCELDVVGLRYSKMAKSVRAEDELELISRTDWDAGGGNNVDWRATVTPLPDYGVRVRSMKNYHTSTRTAKILFEVDGIYGNPERVRQFITEIVDQILISTAIIQGTTPTVSRLLFRSIGNESVPTSGGFDCYTWARSVSLNFGGSGSNSHLLQTNPSELSYYLDCAFPKYRKYEDDLHLRNVLGYYVNSLDPDLNHESKMMNLSTAMELFASRYTRHRPLPSTAEEIKKTVRDLNISIDGLIPVLGSYPTEHHPSIHRQSRRHTHHHQYSAATTLLTATQGATNRSPNAPCKEYFWYRARNYVAHGDSNVSKRELIYDYEMLLTLFRETIISLLLTDEQAGRLPGITINKPRNISTPN